MTDTKHPENLPPWADALAMGPTALARAVGCPVSTAGSWIKRQKGPPQFVRRLVLEDLTRKGALK